MSEQNKRVLRRVFQQVWNEGRLAVIDELYAHDWVGHAPLSELSEPAALKQFVAARRQAMPDLRFRLQAQIAEADLVATRWTASATRAGNAEPSQPVLASGLTLARVACGKIVEEWATWDALESLPCAGPVPSELDLKELVDEHAH
jgi:predicted ester cyclase